MNRISIVTFVGFGIALYAIPIECIAQSNDDLLQTARLGNQSSLALASQMTATATIEIQNMTISPVGSTKFAGDYWRDADSARVSEKDSAGRETRTVVFRGGFQRAVIGFVDPKDRDRKYVSAVIAKEEEPLTQLDVWTLALCYLPHERLTFHEVLSGTHTLLGVKSVKTKYGSGIVVDLETKQKVRYQIRFRESTNYLIDNISTQFRREDGNGKTTKVTREFQVTGFREVAPGVFFPETIVSEHFENSRLIAVHRTSLSNIRLNSKLDPELFNLRIPSNVYVSDRVRGTYYRVDSHEQVVGDVYKYAPVSSQEVQKGLEMLEPQAAAARSQWARILLIVSITAIVTGLILTVRQRTRHSKQ